MKPLPDHAWCAWHPSDLQSRLQFRVGWYVVGGWALDLWHGAKTRDHEDLEFAVLPHDLATAQTLLGELDFFAVEDGRFNFLPPAQQPQEQVRQFWGADREAGCWRVDMMLERGSRDFWVYKRDLAITAPRQQMIRQTQDGIPYLAPAAVLLFKAKHRRPKDERDFSLALPKLDVVEPADLRQWLTLAHAEHDWVKAL